MIQWVVIALLLVGAWFLPIGCAAKKFVRDEIQKSEQRFGTLLQNSETKIQRHLVRLETDLSQQKERVSQVASQTTEMRSLSEETIKLVKRALARGDEALAKAEQAAGTAVQALDKAENTESRLSRVRTDQHKRQLVTSMVVTFQIDRSDLNESGRAALLDVVKQLKEKPALVVDLEGYTDSVGPASYNMQLSQRRMEAVQRFLLENGIDRPRIRPIAFGPANPVADNTSEDGRAQNRRVVIKLFTAAE